MRLAAPITTTVLAATGFISATAAPHRVPQFNNGVSLTRLRSSPFIATRDEPVTGKLLMKRDAIVSQNVVLSVRGTKALGTSRELVETLRRWVSRVADSAADLKTKVLDDDIHHLKDEGLRKPKLGQRNGQQSAEQGFSIDWTRQEEQQKIYDDIQAKRFTAGTESAKRSSYTTLVPFKDTPFGDNFEGLRGESSKSATSLNLDLPEILKSHTMMRQPARNRVKDHTPHGPGLDDERARERDALAQAMMQSLESVPSSPHTENDRKGKGIKFLRK